MLSPPRANCLQLDITARTSEILGWFMKKELLCHPIPSHRLQLGPFVSIIGPCCNWSGWPSPIYGTIILWYRSICMEIRQHSINLFPGAIKRNCLPDRIRPGAFTHHSVSFRNIYFLYDLLCNLFCMFKFANLAFRTFYCRTYPDGIEGGANNAPRSVTVFCRP